MVKTGDLGHLARHNTESFSDDFASLQAAVDDAITQKRPLRIAPKTYILTAPLVVNAVSDMHIFAFGATFVASGTLSSLIELRDTTRCTWSGGWLNIPNGSTSGNGFYVYRDIGQSTHNHISDVVVEGHYGAGLRIGKPGSGFQCDHVSVDNLECIGRGDSDQVGVYIGTGLNANCLNHAINNLMCTQNDIHIVVDATNAYLSNVWLDTAQVDIRCLTTILSIEHIRSEDGGRFMDDAGPSSVGSSIAIRDLLWNGQVIHADGKWLKHNGAGLLELDNVRVMHSAVRPVIDCQPSAPLALHVRGLMEGGGAIACPFAGAFNVNGNTTIRTDSYIELDTNSAVAVIT